MAELNRRRRAFDLLELDGRDLRREPLERRKVLLERHALLWVQEHLQIWWFVRRRR